MNKLQRYGRYWNHLYEEDDGQLCMSRDVAELEAQHAKLEAINTELLEALEAVVTIAKEAHAHWDAGRDSKLGKIILALAGANGAYDKRIDAIRAAIAKAKGEVMP